MKKFNKSDLTIIDGLLVCEKTDEIVVIDSTIVKQANALETMLQQAEYLSKQPEAAPEPSLDGFKRQSIYDENNKFSAATPLLDAKYKETLAFMDELDDAATVDEANDLLQQFDKLMSFVKRDFVFDCGGDPVSFDTPTLGNVLELTQLDIMRAVGSLCGMQQDEMVVKPSDDEKLAELYASLSTDADEDIQ